MNITFSFGSIRWNFTFISHVPLGSSFQSFFIRFWIRELVDAWCAVGWGKGGWEFIFMDVVQCSRGSFILQLSGVRANWKERNDMIFNGSATSSKALV